MTKQVANILPDNRRQSSIIHNILTMLRQRVFGLAAGYEDLNDHNTLRNDIAIQTSVNSDESLASSPTLCRFENSMPKELLFDMHKIFIRQFISSYELPPKELILDFDATDTILHGDQEGKFYHGYYNNYCFYRSMYFATSSYWSAIKGLLIKMGQSIVGQYWHYW